MGEIIKINTGDVAPVNDEGGLMDVIRCDESEYLIWKWRPAGAEPNDSKKENAIRYGSSLRVKDGSMGSATSRRWFTTIYS